MKSITIPKKFGYPTVTLTVNGKEQTFASGVEISVENAVAEAIDNAIALAPTIGVTRSKIAQLAEESLKKLAFEDLEGISTISNCAFYSCKSLTVVEIPNGITKIGNNAFDWCVNLCVVRLPETPPTLTNANGFDNINVSCKFYCKTQESLNAYKAATNWSTLTGKYTFAVES